MKYNIKDAIGVATLSIVIIAAASLTGLAIVQSVNEQTAAAKDTIATLHVTSTEVTKAIEDNTATTEQIIMAVKDLDYRNCLGAFTAQGMSTDVVSEACSTAVYGDTEGEGS